MADRKFLVLGDSFVSRLKDSFQSLVVDGKEVTLWGFPGKTVSFLSCHLSGLSVHAVQYHLAVLSVGSNDTCDAKLTPGDVVERLMDLARLLLTKFGVTRVVVCLLLHRSKWSRHMKGMTLEDYNDRIDAVNGMLGRRCHRNGWITVWYHQGCLGPNHLAADGVHLNHSGLKHYRRSLHSAIVNNI
jgi:lysophospholipase L1-like esterase